MWLIDWTLKLIGLGSSGMAEAANEAGWMVFAWKVLSLSLGAGFYRFVVLAGLLTIGGLVWMHCKTEGFAVDFRLTRLIGAVPLLVVSLVTLGAFLGAVSESVTGAVEAHRRLTSRPPLQALERGEKAAPPQRWGL